MNREKFIERLAFLLADLPEEERDGVLDYYNDYLDEAGPENENSVLESLGSPEDVARIIRAGMETASGDAGQFTEHGYEDQRFSKDMDIPDVLHGVPMVRASDRNRKKEDTEQEKRSAGGTAYGQNPGRTGYRWQQPPSGNGKQGMSKGAKIIIIVLVCLCAAPVLLPIAGGVIGVLVGILSVMAAILLAAGIVGAAFVVSGIVIAFVGIIKLGFFPGTALLMTGMGLILAALGVVFIALFVGLCAGVFPRIIRGIVNLCRKVFRKGGKKA